MVLAKHREAMALLETEPERPLTVEPEVTRLQTIMQFKYVHADFKEDGGTQLAGGGSAGGGCEVAEGGGAVASGQDGGGAGDSGGVASDP